MCFHLFISMQKSSRIPLMKIHIQDLIKQFGDKTAVSIPKFDVEKPEIISLVGNNGAGKTTLFHLMLDLLQPTQGIVTFSLGIDDIPINPAQSELWKQYTGAFLDESFLIDFLTPEEYFDFIARIAGLHNNTLQERLAVFAPLMNNEIMGQKKLIRDFSAGNKQKIGIIAALLHHPELVILDEPFNFLDPSSQHALKQVLTNYARTQEATLLISSHNIGHTVDISTRIVLLENGKIIKDLPNTNKEAQETLNQYFQNTSTQTLPNK